jgi:hypothetical protein
MADESSKVAAGPEPTAASETTNPGLPPENDGERPEREERSERPEWGVTDFVRRAVSAGVGAAARSKDDIVRVAATEMRSWLDHLNLSDEIAKSLAKMVIEVKTEIRFRPADDGKLVPETTNDVKLKPSK